jgi:hypothetical protein
MSNPWRGMAAALALGVMSLGGTSEAFGGRRAPLVEQRLAPEYDGLGRKKRRPRTHWKRGYGSRQMTPNERSAFKAKVLSTHRVLPNGTWQEDPREAKYLHSHARAFRGLSKALAMRSAA